LSDYYDKNIKVLFELNIGSMTMDEYEMKFHELLRYVCFIKDEKFKIQIFLRGTPSFNNDKIHYDEPSSKDTRIFHNKKNCLCEHNKGRLVFQKDLDDKKKINMEKRKKAYKPPFFKNSSQGQPTKNEPMTIEYLGKRPIYQPIKC
jgi:hypothetical protein